jgi:glycosyltransferase involved in cell wall biosynthesis
LIEQRRSLKQSEISRSLLDSLSKIAANTIARFNPDIVHLHNAHHFAPELALGFFQNQVSAPMINSVHDRVGEPLYRSVLQFEWTHTLYASQYLFDSLPSAKGPNSILRLGIDLDSFSPTGELDGRFAEFERPIIFHPARLLRWKGITVGLEAFIRLRQQLKTGSLVLSESRNIVDDPSEVRQLRFELEDRSRITGVERYVHFLSFDRSRIAAAYRASDLVWYPTIDEEPFGLVPLEAMASGVPVIVSDSGGMRETVAPGLTGIVVPRNDSQALADAARQLLVNEGLRAKIAEAGRRRVEAFDMKNYTTSLETIYEEASGG